jgi:hypothetical protein
MATTHKLDIVTMRRRYWHVCSPCGGDPISYHRTHEAAIIAVQRHQAYDRQQGNPVTEYGIYPPDTR